MKFNANSRQEGGSHYAVAPGGMQHWDYVLLALNGRYLEGALTKYVTRWRRKDGVRDLEKAAHFLEKLLEAAAARHTRPLAPRSQLWRWWQRRRLEARARTVTKFVSDNSLTDLEEEIVHIVAGWQDVGDLLMVKALLVRLLAEARGGK